MGSPSLLALWCYLVKQDSQQHKKFHQYWVEREHLDTVLPFPAGYHDLHLNPKTGVLGILTGVGHRTHRPPPSWLSASIRCFDLTHAYFSSSQASAASTRRWAPSRPPSGPTTSSTGTSPTRSTPAKFPEDWKTGYVPLGKSTPYEQPRAARFGDDGNVYHLKHRSSLTGPSRLPKTHRSPTLLRKSRNAVCSTKSAAAHRPPFVRAGDNLSAATFWHGKLLNQWARRLGQIPDRRPRHLRHLRHGRDTGTPPVPHLARQGKQARHQPRTRPPAPRRTTTSSASASPQPKASPKPKSANTARICPLSTMPIASATSSSTILSPTGPKPAIIYPQNRHPKPSNARALCISLVKTRYTSHEVTRSPRRRPVRQDLCL